jgi:hypothetical protein
MLENPDHFDVILATQCAKDEGLEVLDLLCDCILESEVGW